MLEQAKYENCPDHGLFLYGGNNQYRRYFNLGEIDIELLRNVLNLVRENQVRGTVHLQRWS